MLNPTTLTFGRESDNESDTDCKMIIRVEETNVEIYFNLFDENGFHRYELTHSGIKFTSSLVPKFAELFTAYAFADTTVTGNGWMCVCELESQISDMF